ncbi:nucleosome assembly protein 1;2-like isoform X2 [Trifolium pratense]|uniref:nucleosome assembly protein 1;2-like isoform X2 n=1 Tax=Trifolium pratense TaxID=57577 RepID=UPI001E690CA1|nr:nucleosome assembly protein 1;2-like isoform X2 [Trifolium pratense]
MTNKKKGSNVADLISSIMRLFNEEDRADSVNYPMILSMEKIKHLKEIQRYKIVNGVAEAEGVTSETTTEAEVEVTNETKAEAEENGVPSFWLNAMKIVLAEEIMESDEDVLKYLEDIECTTIEDPKGLVLKFSLKSNPNFYDPYLEQTFHIWDRNFLETRIPVDTE